MHSYVLSSLLKRQPNVYFPGPYAVQQKAEFEPSKGRRSNFGLASAICGKYIMHFVLLSVLCDSCQLNLT